MSQKKPQRPMKNKIAQLAYSNDIENIKLSELLAESQNILIYKSYGSGSGDGSGYGFGSGDGYGYGFGDGSGYGFGDGDGYGFGDGDVSGYGYGDV